MNPKAQIKNDRTFPKELQTRRAELPENEIPEYDTLDERLMTQSGNMYQPGLSKEKIQKVYFNQRIFCRLTLIFLSIATIVILACSVVPTTMFLLRLETTLEKHRDRHILPPVQSDSVLPDLQIVHRNNCYCLYTEKLNWFQARDFCHFRRGVGHLAEIQLQDTNTFLTPILRAFRPKLAIWLGGSDLEKDGEWIWDTSRTRIDVFAPTQWDYDEPSGYYNSVKEDCLDAFNYKVPEAFLWNDDNCNDFKYFLCQSPLTRDGLCDC